MSNFQQRDMSGVLFKNDKDGNEKRPDYTGDITINGETFKLSAWIKEGQKGKFMSLSAQPKQEKPAAPPQRQQQRASSDFDDNSDIPF